jgi:hypothetical protein
VSYARLDFDRPVQVTHGNRAPGAEWNGLDKLQRHTVFADLPAAGKQGRILHNEPDREIDGESGGSVFKFLHHRSFHPRAMLARHPLGDYIDEFSFLF